MMIWKGAAMDSTALKTDGLAHHKAIGGIDGKGGTFLGDYTAANAAIGHMVASAGEAQRAAVRVRVSVRLRVAAGVLAMLGAPAAHADQIDDAA